MLSRCAGFVQINRDHVHAVRVGDDLMPGAMDGAHGLRPLLGQDAVGHDAGADAVARGDRERTPDPAGRAVEAPGSGVSVEEAGLQRVAHRADAGRLAFRPAFVGDVEDDADAASAGKAEVVGGAVDAAH